MPDRFPSSGSLPPRLGHAPSLSTSAAAAQQGMVRIHRDGEVRYVWPVHVAGWLSSGWLVGEVESRLQGAAAPVISQRPGQDVQLPGPAGTLSSAPEPPAAPAITADEPVGEPIDAHLPTNLLDLDLEPVAPAPVPISAIPPEAPPAEAPLQQAIEPNDAEPASFSGTDQAGGDAVGPTSTGLYDVDAGEQPAAATSEEPAAPADLESPAPETSEPSEDEPTPPPAPARRGRPRKVRPEAQAEPATEPVKEAGSEPQPPASADIREPSDLAMVLSTDGDDPFGIDPLL